MFSPADRRLLDFGSGLVLIEDPLWAYRARSARPSRFGQRARPLLVLMSSRRARV